MTSTDASVNTIDFHGQPALELRAPDGATCVVSLFGAQVLSWVPAGGKERLYLSPQARFDGRSALRGGIPVVFPQFAERGSGPRHGFARTLVWQVDQTRVSKDFAIATLRLTDDDATRTLWPHAFALELTVVIGGNRLDLELSVDNTGSDAFDFAAALHSYLRVAEVENCRLEGLRNTSYLDATDGDKAKDDRLDALIVEDEVDRLYRRAPDTVVLHDGARALGFQSDGFPDLVVWNPWEHKCRALNDMPDLDFRRMICIEPAIAERTRTLAAGEQWSGRHTIVAA
ncbi:MAG: D-hexose-6-phosphate mutarotase [Methyloversatilis sp.]|jgi:glucose-6-phosphate 1-epimerase|nr:D-hexose-6-phosphate mutarotase [Methyloversatilis sp.]